MLSNLRQLIFRSRARGSFGTRGAITLRWAMLRRATARKLGNMLIIKIQKRFRPEVVRGLPYRYKIDPTNVCELHCPLCPTGLNHEFRPKGFLEFSDYARFLDQIAPTAMLVDLFGWGEPILHPKIGRIIEHASRRGVFVRLSTTLHAVERDTLEDLVDSGLDAMIVAVDGSDHQTHRKFRAGGDLPQVLGALQDLVAMKRARGSSLPHITVRLLVNRLNENQIPEVRDMIRKLGVDAFTVGSVAINTEDRKQADKWLPRNSKISAYGKDLKNRGACEDLWEAMVINWDGGLAPCCWEYHSESDLGNAFDENAAETWNSPAIRKARRIVSGREVGNAHLEHICQRCQGMPDYLARK